MIPQTLAMAPRFHTKKRTSGVLQDARKPADGPSKESKLSPDDIRQYYAEWGVKMATNVPALDKKWFDSPVRFGHVQHNFTSYETFGDILRAKGQAAFAVETLLRLRLPQKGKPLLFFGWVCSFLNGLIKNVSPDIEETSSKAPFGALLTPRSLRLIRLFQAAECYPLPGQAAKLPRERVV